MAVVIRKMKVEDLVDAKGVDLLCWNDLMERSYGVRGRMSPRTDENVLSYLHSDPEGAFVASDEFAGIIGTCFSHVWGTTGWVGPLSVLPSYQARGLGKELLKRSLGYLEDQGCVDIGLETMPENPTNLGMYFKAGLRPEALILVLAKKVEAGNIDEESDPKIIVERFSDSDVKEPMLKQMRRLSGALRIGLDHTKEVEITQQFSLGDTLVAIRKDKVVGFAVVHTVPRRVNMSTASVRVLAADQTVEEAVLGILMSSAELMAAEAKSLEASIAVPALCRRALDLAFSREYFVVQSFERLMWMGSSGVGENVYNLCSWSG